MNDTQRPTWCEIDLSAIEHNYLAIDAHVGSSQVMPIVKADAYGHGHRQVAQRLQELNAPCLGVAYVEEGIALRKADITLPIHVLGGAVERQNTAIPRTRPDFHGPFCRQTAPNR